MTTSIICRYDNANQKPVVFLVDNIDYEKGMLKAWSNNQTSDVNLAYYHTTLPLSQADNKALMQQYMNATSNPDVVLRDRLPRQAKQRPNVVVLQPQTTPAVVEQQRQRNKRQVPNRITVQETQPQASGYTFDPYEAIEATRREFNDKLDALVRAMQHVPNVANVQRQQAVKH